MRKLTQCDSERDARRLVDHLLVAEVDSELRGSDPWEVWVFDDRTMDTARRELERFAEGGAALRTREAAGSTRAAAGIRKRREREGGPRIVDVAARWRSNNRSDSPGLGPVTVFLIAASLLVAYFGDFDAPHLNPTIQTLSIEPWTSTQFLVQIRAGEVWRLVSPMLIHFGLVHLAFNMLWLWRLGSEVEHRHGSLALVGLVLLAQVPSGLGQYLASGPNFGGMSGVVYGLFGFVWMQARYNPDRRYQLGSDTAVIMMIWFMVCLTGIVGPIANVGHAGGLLAGLLVAMPAYVRHLRERARVPEFAEGSWADEKLHGWRRIARRYFSPYVPLWFLLLAAVALLVDFWP